LSDPTNAIDRYLLQVLRILPPSTPIATLAVSSPAGLFVAASWDPVSQTGQIAAGNGTTNCLQIYPTDPSTLRRTGLPTANYCPFNATAQFLTFQPMAAKKGGVGSDPILGGDSLMAAAVAASSTGGTRFAAAAYCRMAVVEEVLRGFSVKAFPTSGGGLGYDVPPAVSGGSTSRITIAIRLFKSSFETPY
jgi:hypothetical protein